jgi:ribose transport system permease protein
VSVSERSMGVPRAGSTVPAVARRLARDGVAAWLVVVVLLAVLVARKGSIFLSTLNVADLLSQMVVLGLVSVGQTYVMITGGIDLSVGSLATLTTVLTAGLIAGHAALTVPVLVLVILIGAAVGLAHGLLVTRARLAPFIVTLASYFLLQGLAFAYTSTPVGSIPAALSSFVYSQIGPIPVIFLIVLVIAAVLSWVLARTRFGVHVYASGGDPAIARSAGIPVGRVVTTCYVVSGVLAAVAGYVLAARANVGTPSAGSGLELNAITAAVIGGTSLLGGRGKIIGTAGGVALLALIENGFTLLSISSFYQELILGAVIVAAVAIITQRKRS